MAADSKSTSAVACGILDVCADSKAWPQLNEHILILSKRRAQLQKATETMIRHAANDLLPLITNTQDRTKFIETVREVSDGKIYVELERARLTRTLAESIEADGDVSRAADVLQEIQVETIGTMETRERLDYLLEQVRLCLLKNDLVRADILSKKVDLKLFKDESIDDLKIRFYKLRIQSLMQTDSYRRIALAWEQIYFTKRVQDDAVQWREALQQLCIFASLTPHDSESADLMHRLAADKKVHTLPHMLAIIEQFNANELMPWPMTHEQQWKNDHVFQPESAMKIDPPASAAAVKVEGRQVSAAGAAAAGLTKIGPEQRWSDLHKRCVQHNIRVIAQYYSRISLPRLSKLLQLTDVDQCETYLAEMITAKQCRAKCNRPAMQVTFAPTQAGARTAKTATAPEKGKADKTKLGDSTANDQPAVSYGAAHASLETFSTNIAQLLAKLDQTCHVINKENMIHGVK